MEKERKDSSKTGRKKKPKEAVYYSQFVVGRRKSRCSRKEKGEKILHPKDREEKYSIPLLKKIDRIFPLEPTSLST